MPRFREQATQALVIAAFLALWEVASRAGWIDTEIVPPFSAVIATAIQMLVSGAFTDDLLTTVLEVGAAYLLSVPAGLLLGFMIGESRRLERMVVPPLQLIMAVPKAIFLPLFIIAFGIGFAQKMFFAGMLSFFVLILCGIAAVRSVSPGLVTLSRSLGATRGQLYTRIYLPAMAPLIIEGMRLGFVFCIFGVLLAEMYGSQRGMGRLVFVWADMFRMKEFFACVLVIFLLTVAVNEGFRSAEARLMPGGARK